MKAVDTSRAPIASVRAVCDRHLLMVGAGTMTATRRSSAAATSCAAGGYAVAAEHRCRAMPEEVIADGVERDQIDLLVMGAYGHSRIRSLIIGSTTTEMIRSCKIPSCCSGKR